MKRRSAREKAAELLDLVIVSDPERLLSDFPHRFSGGMRQLVMIAIALAREPKLLIANEPATALDPAIQAQILELIRRLRESLVMTINWIPQYLGVIEGIAGTVRWSCTRARSWIRRRLKNSSPAGFGGGPANRCPHDSSGGQRQRIEVARFLASTPSLVICGEPFAALDESVQAQAVDLLEELQEERGLASLFISHDLGTDRHIVNLFAAMYSGKIVELAPCYELYENPKRRYTEEMLSAAPEAERSGRRTALDGEAPSPADPAGGCVFCPRCPKAEPIRRAQTPAFTGDGPAGSASWHLLAPDSEPVPARHRSPLPEKESQMKILKFAATAAILLGAVSAAYAERGSDGNVGIIYWQAPSILNPYLSGGTKDIEAASLVIEPLARFDARGNIVPWLAESVPTTANGGVSTDLTAVTWKLRPGLIWSDGTPVTADDVVFTAEYCLHPGSGCAQLGKFSDVASVTALDDLTVRISFAVPKPYPYSVFVGAETPILQKVQFAGCLGAEAPGCAEQNFNPIGTGPFRVTDFRPNDAISMEANPNYRDPEKPAFASLTLKGGGDAAAAGRAVLETGEFDYAWNLQLPPDALQKMQEAGKGRVVSAFGTMVERILVNLTDPRPGLGGERSTRKHPHPFLNDRAVRKALSMAIDRGLLTEIGYGQAGKPTCNVVPAPDIFVSTANDLCLVQDIEGANKLLEEAGWVPGPDGVRAKDGVRLSMLYQTSTDPVRQAFQALIKRWWAEIGVETELRNISASVFFGSDPGSSDTFQKFYADVQMYANNFAGTDPEPYLGNWRCGNDPRPETQWQGSNMPRYCSRKYDMLLAEMAQTGDLAERARLGKAMNDMLVQDHIILPLVHRGRVSAHANTLGGVKLNTWDSELWNAADWRRTD